MAETKRIMICVPTALLEEVDGMVSLENKNRSELIREAMRFYLEENKKKSLREQMRKGYQAMAEINLTLAREAAPCEEEVEVIMVSNLAECC